MTFVPSQLVDHVEREWDAEGQVAGHAPRIKIDIVLEVVGRGLAACCRPLPSLN